MKQQPIPTVQETVLTKAEFKTLEGIFKKTNIEDLPSCFDVLDELLTYSFTKFFSAQPTVIKTLLQAKVSEGERAEIEAFLDNLTNVNETLMELKETRHLLDRISDFFHETHRAETKYVFEPQDLETSLN